MNNRRVFFFVMWFDECHEFREIEPAWLFGIAQCEPKETPLRFTDGHNVVVVSFAADCFVVNGDDCCQSVFDDICELGRWLGHRVVGRKKHHLGFEDVRVLRTSRGGRHSLARKVAVS